MHWVGAHQTPGVQAVMLEITALGTGTVVGMIVLIAGMFLWLNHHRHSAILLIAATLGGLVLDNLLKIGFNRPRPQIFEWGTHAASSSFPSGHAMSSVIVYGTVAYLAARLQRNVASRVLTFAFAAVIIVADLGEPRLPRRALPVGYPRRTAHRPRRGRDSAWRCSRPRSCTRKCNAPQMLVDERPPPQGASPSS